MLGRVQSRPSYSPRKEDMNEPSHVKHPPQFHVGDTWQTLAVKSLDTVASAVADVAIRPTLVQHGDMQVMAYFDNERRLTVANRNISGLNWDFRKADSTVGWDSHNYIDLGFDRIGRLHIAGNMHATPLQYWVTDLESQTTLRRIDVLSDESRERKVTYPRFLRDHEGQLLFTYRDGTSGDGDFICLRWNDESESYQALSDGALIEGGGERNAYIDTNAPILGPDGTWHMLWVWRDSPHAESTHTINYARSPDLINWVNGDGRPVSSPISYDALTIVDPVPAGHGLINNNVRLGFFPSGDPIVVYHKNDSSNYQQIWAATYDGTNWVRRLLTEWSYRWDFAGQGSLDFKIEIGAPRTTSSAVLVDIRRDQDVETFSINEELSRTSVAAAAPWSPLRRDSIPGGLYQRVTQGRGWAPGDPASEWFVSYRSVPEQRDLEPTGGAVPPQPIAVGEIFESAGYQSGSV